MIGLGWSPTRRDLRRSRTAGRLPDTKSGYECDSTIHRQAEARSRHVVKITCPGSRFLRPSSRTQPCSGRDVIRSECPRETSGNPTLALLKRMPAREQDTARISEKVTKSEQTSR
jgi:hypothetical protein